MFRSKLSGSTALIALAFAVMAPSVSEARQIDDEIIVTATKRQQTLQEVPVAVSVTSAETIEKAQILDILDLQSVVPSLRVTQLQTASNTNFIIRGFGNGANNTGIEPSVGVFIDGVYRSRSAAQIGDFPNLERIEVLRGPQSTLFGKNASAGVVSVVTVEPEFETSGFVEAGLGNYNQRNLRGFITSGNEEGSFAASLGGSWNKRDGYGDNLATGDDNSINDRNRFSIMGQALLLPSDSTKIRLIADYSEIDEVCCLTTHLTDGGAGVIIRNVLGGTLSDPADRFSYEAAYDSPPINKVKDGGVSLHGTFDLGFAELTSISAYRNNDRFQDIDLDFSSLDILDSNIVDTQIDTFTQELRLTSTGEGNLDWMIGGFFFDEAIDETSTVGGGSLFRPYVDTLTGGAITAVENVFVVPAGTFFSDALFVQEFAEQDNTAISIFGTVDWALTEKLTATGGLNYTWDSKDVEIRQVNNDAFSAIDLSGTPLAGLAAVQFLPPFLEIPNAVEDGESTDDDLTWTARLAYDVGSNVNVYASAATGFKATSWNLTRDSRPFQADATALGNSGLLQVNQTFGTRFAEPEESTVYELGLKARFEKGAINLAVFDQTIEGFQSNVFVGTGFRLVNAGKQSVKGVEVDATFTPVEPLTLTFAGTFLDPLYDSFEEATGIGNNNTINLSGETPFGIHKVSLTTSATYNHNFSNGATGFLRAEYVYEDDVPIIENVPADLARREVNVVNASAGVTFDNGVGVRVWARNLFNDEYLLSAFPGVAQPGVFLGYPNPPRTFGASLRYDF